MRSAITISLVPEARGGPFVFEDLADGCEKAAALGFDAVEIFPRAAVELDASRIRELLSKHKLELAALGTGAGWVVKKLRLTDPSAGVRAEAMDFARAIVELAARFGAPAIVGSMQGRIEAGVTRDLALEWLADGLNELGQFAENQGCALLFEPLNRYETNVLNTIRDSMDFLASLKTRNVRLLCDLFHMNIEEPNIPESLQLAGTRVGHVHFADSNRRAVGFGHTDIAPIAAALKAIGYAGFISAEILPVPDADTAAKRTISSFRKWFPRPETERRIPRPC